MIRMGDKIRLNTEAEKSNFRKTTGRVTLPTTVAEHNSAVDVAQKDWVATNSPEGRLLAGLMEYDKI